MAPPAANHMPGILMVTLAGFAVIVSDALIKHVSMHHDVVQTVWVRNIFVLILALLLCSIYRRRRPLYTRQPVLQGIRGLIGLTSSLCLYVAILFMPLGDAISILFAGPLLILALSQPLLGEKVGIGAWVAVLAGFSGVLLVIRPGFSEFHWVSLLAIATAVLWAFHQLIARQLAVTDNSLTTLTYMAIVGFAGTSLLVPFFWTPLSPSAWLLMACAGIVYVSAHWGIIKAIELTPVAVLAPFHYSQVLSALLIDYFVFDDVPDRIAAVGIGSILVAGLAVTCRAELERRSSLRVIENHRGTGSAG